MVTRRNAGLTLSAMFDSDEQHLNGFWMLPIMSEMKMGRFSRTGQPSQLQEPEMRWSCRSVATRLEGFLGAVARLSEDLRMSLVPDSKSTRRRVASRFLDGQNPSSGPRSLCC